MRGQPGFGGESALECRIIPARAGPTCRSAARHCQISDHPRSCGANMAATTSGKRRGGSSPLVRGQQLTVSRHTIISRIIPARAGPTFFCAVSNAWLADHPRSCGANLQMWEVHIISFGSSPLVRGQPIVRDGDIREHRIIPARAGPTSLPPLVIAMLADHPRSCGANSTSKHPSKTLTGSSPLVRGQRAPHA